MLKTIVRILWFQIPRRGYLFVAKLNNNHLPRRGYPGKYGEYWVAPTAQSIFRTVVYKHVAPNGARCYCLYVIGFIVGRR